MINISCDMDVHYIHELGEVSDDTETIWTSLISVHRLKSIGPSKFGHNSFIFHPI